jgi:simple sugar transport system permease protein
MDWLNILPAFLMAVLPAMFRLATPMIFASLGGVISERSGVVNIGLEGIMIMGAFAGVMTALSTGNPWLGILAGMISGGLVALIHAYISIDLHGDQVISGTAINVLAAAFTGFMLRKMFHHAGQSPQVTALPTWDLPFLQKIPVVGSWLYELFRQGPMVYLAIIMVVVIWFLLYKTRLGLRIRAAGEHPEAVETVGINLFGIRYFSVVMSGVLAGLGGVAISLGSISSFVENMSAGKGFIALAAMIFGKWNPIGAFLACLFFALTDAVQMQAQIFGITFIPKEFLMMFPYIATMLALLGFIGRSTAPAADGVAYERRK